MDIGVVRSRGAWASFAISAWLVAFLTQSACHRAQPNATETSPVMSRQAARANAAGLVDLGRRMFVDPSISGSGRMSCASCHDPSRAFSPANALPVQMGGANLNEPGVRAVPSLTYLQAAPQFTEHFFESNDEGDGSIDNGPTGGLTWDGRVDRGSAQARIPLLSPFEMANGTVANVAAKARRASYAGALRDLTGPAAFSNDEALFAVLVHAFEAFEQDAATFYPYSSRYDAFLAGREALSESERRGLAAFGDPAKGNCARCHTSARGKSGTPPQFTDYGFAALGVPRNSAIPANADPAYFDLGLCGPYRADLKKRPEYCGLFMTPTLRNVALRQTFFHNGEFHSLTEVVRFYASRDTAPGHWYSRDASGVVVPFDDLPPQYQRNIDRETPFGQRRGQQPSLTDRDIDDIVAFLRTLSDVRR